MHLNSALKPLHKSGWFFSLIFILVFSTPAWDAGARPLGTVKVGLKSSPSIYVRYLVLEPLMVSDAGRIRPVLAESWQWVDDKTLEVRLRTGVHFHDGSLFDASAVKANFDFFRQWSSIKFFRIYFDGTRCEIIAPHRVRFVLPEPDGFFIFQLAKVLQVAPERLKRMAGKPYTTGIFPSPGDWGTGPFRITAGFVERTASSKEIDLTAFEDYWDPGYPKVQQLILYDLARHFHRPAPEAMDFAYKTVMENEGDIDITPVPCFETLAVNKNIVVPSALRDERFLLREIKLSPGHWSLRHEPLVVGGTF